jgi:hypothetical protein
MGPNSTLSADHPHYFNVLWKCMFHAHDTTLKHNKREKKRTVEGASGVLARKNAKIPQVGKVNNYRNPFLESRVLEVIIWSFFSFSLFLQPRFNCYPKILRYRQVSQKQDYIFQEQQQSLSV